MRKNSKAICFFLFFVMILGPFSDVHPEAPFMPTLANATVQQLLIILQRTDPSLTAEQIATKTGFEPKQILEMLDGKPPARAQGKKTESKVRGYIYANKDERYLKLGALLVEYGRGIVETAESFCDIAYREQCGRGEQVGFFTASPEWLVADNEELIGTVTFPLRDELKRIESRAKMIREAIETLKGKSADDVNSSTDLKVVRAVMLGKALSSKS